jgi:hypothetical protein
MWRKAILKLIPEQGSTFEKKHETISGICRYDRPVTRNDLALDGVSRIRWDKWDEIKLDQLRKAADRLKGEGKSKQEISATLPTLRKMDPRYLK